MKLVLLFLVTCLSTGRAVGGQEPSVDDLVGRVLRSTREEKEVWTPTVEAIGERRTEEALRGLKKIVELLPRRDQLDACFHAARHFLGGSLETDVLDWMEGLALSGDRPVCVRAARGLARFGSVAGEELWRVMEQGSTSSAATHALGGLLEELERDPTSDHLRLLLLHTKLGQTCTRSRFLEVLRAFDLRHLQRYSSLKETSAFAQAALMEALFSGNAVGEMPPLRPALRDPAPPVTYAALLGLLQRPRMAPDSQRAELTRLARSEVPSLRRSAAILVGRLELEGEAGTKLAKWFDRKSRSQAATDRQAAAFLLAEVGAREPAFAVERLHRLLADHDRTVVSEALLALRSVRRLESIPVLITRMEKASGQPLHDLRDVLRDLTGVDHGLTPARWRAWWTDVATTFQLPTPEEIAARRAELEALAEEHETKADFYGLPVVSEHLAFVLDVSGSMKKKVEGETTRLGIAIDELLDVLRRLRDGAEVNVVFFSTDVHAWSDKLEVLDADSRANLEAFIDEQFPRGDTNLYGGLEAALRDPRIDTLYILTDGEPTVGQTIDPESILGEVDRWNSTRHVVIHGVAVGTEDDIVRELTERTGGRYLVAE